MAALLLRRVVGVLSALLLATGTVTALALPAQAEDGYQYWNYFHLKNGAWVFSDVGVAQYQPKDGAVEGFRYGTSTTSKGIEPRADLKKVGFATVCGDTKPPAGRKRVAVVLDYGVELGNGTPPKPRADCATVPRSATTQQILLKVAQVRLGSGMTCGIDGYPATGCGVPVKNATVPAKEAPVSFALPSDGAGNASAASTSQSQDGSNLWTAAGVAALVLVIAVAALLVSRRNKVA